MLPEYRRNFPMHWHNEMEIICGVSGRCIINVQSERYILGAGEMILIQPGNLHSIEQDGSSHAEYFNIIFDFSLLENPDSRCYRKYFKAIYNHERIVPVYLSPEMPLARLLFPIVTRLIKNRHEKYTTQELMIKSGLYEIIYHINTYCTDPDKDSAVLYKNSGAVKEAMRYVHEHYSEQITVHDAAELVNYSTSHFGKLFKSVAGISFTQYIINYRLHIAVSMLKDNTKTETEIALEVGFSSLSHFIRYFRRMYKKSPSEWLREGAQ